MKQIIELRPRLPVTAATPGEAQSEDNDCLKAGEKSFPALPASAADAVAPGAGLEQDGSSADHPLPQASRLLAALRGQLQGLLADREQPLEDKGAVLRDLLLAWVRQFYAEPACRSGAQLDLARELLAACYRLLGGAPHPGRLAQGLRRHDAGLAGHCLNVTLLGLSFARHYAWPETAARTFGLGALLHDLGMATLAGTWEKSGPLSGQEMEALRLHPQAGIHLLAPFPQLPGKVFIMVAQHHENADGSGYPLGLPLSAIHPYARLLRVLDSFESLTSIRPWRGPLNPDKALTCMRYSAAEQSEFDVRVLVHFQRLWSPPEPEGGGLRFRW